METYNYLPLEELVHEREKKHAVAKLSDWNSSLEEVKVPLDIYVEAFGRSLATLTKYPETSVTYGICEELVRNLNSNAIKASAMHLYGSGTQAINMLFFALHRITKLTTPNEKTILFISPTYFSAIDSAKSFGFNTSEIHRTSVRNFEIEIDEIGNQLKEFKALSKPICAIFITEPVYSSGKCEPDGKLTKVSKYCKDNGLFLIIDGSFSGLRWDVKPHWQDEHLLAKLEDHVALIDSLSKKLFFLNTKIGVLYGSKVLIAAAREGADWLSGNITALQQELSKTAFSKDYAPQLSQISAINLETFKSRFEKLKQLLKGTKYDLLRPDAGYHAMAFRNDGKFNRDVDAMAWCKRLLQKNVFALPAADFKYSMEDTFGFRISLTRNHSDEAVQIALQEPIN